MKPSTEDKTTGNLHEVKGAIKQKAGELTNNPTWKLMALLKRTREKFTRRRKIEKAVGE